MIIKSAPVPVNPKLPADTTRNKTHKGFMKRRKPLRQPPMTDPSMKSDRRTVYLHFPLKPFQNLNGNGTIEQDMISSF